MNPDRDKDQVKDSNILSTQMLGRFTNPDRVLPPCSVGCPDRSSIEDARSDEISNSDSVGAAYVPYDPTLYGELINASPRLSDSDAAFPATSTDCLHKGTFE